LRRLDVDILDDAMSSDRVRYQYDNLEGFARQFSDHASDAQQVRSRLSRQLEVLEDGGWIGEGASRFSAEMRDSILPALDALTRALDSANSAILRATEMMRDAENEAAALFKAVDIAVQAASGSFDTSTISPSDRAQQVAGLTTLRDEQMRFVQELRRSMDGLGGQLAGVQDAYTRLMTEAAERSERMTALIESMQGGSMP
jgi:WXG100 family type VII secretion target